MAGNDAVFGFQIRGKADMQSILAELRAGINEAKNMGTSAMEDIDSKAAAGAAQSPSAGGRRPGAGGQVIEEALPKGMPKSMQSSVEKMVDDMYAAWETAITRAKTRAMNAMRDFPGNNEANVEHDIAWSRLQTDRTQGRVTDGRYAIYEGENQAWKRLEGQAVDLSSVVQARQLLSTMGSVMIGGSEVPIKGLDTLANLAGLERQQGRDLDSGAQLAAVKALNDAIEKATAALLNMANAEDLAAARIQQGDLQTETRLHEARMRVGRGPTDSETQLRQLEDENRRAQSAALQDYRKANGLAYAGIGGGGSILQQFQGELDARRGRAGTKVNTDYMTAGQYFSEHALRTLGYAVPGIAIGAGFEEMRMAYEESQKAQRSMREMEAEFQGLGQQSQFSGFATSIKDISASTGVAVSEVVQLGIAMKGVYGDTNQATIATRGIAMATVTMGMSMQEAREDMTAITQGFSDLQAQGGKAMITAQNMALHLQDVTGVEAKDLLPGTADVAPTANAIGLSSYQTMSMVAAAAQHSGLSSATIGETLSKIITGLSSNPGTMGNIERYLSMIPNSGVNANIGTLPMAQQVQQVLAALPKMSGATEQFVLTQLGLNASALPAANALGQTGAEAAQLAQTPAPGDRAQEEFQKQMDTLSGRLSQLRQNFVNLGVGILNSGLGKALTDLASMVADTVGFFGRLNKDSGGVIGAMAGIAGGVVAIKALVSGLQLATAALAAFRTAIGVDTAATEENAAVQGLGGVVKGGGGLSGLLGRAGVGADIFGIGGSEAGAATAATFGTGGLLAAVAGGLLLGDMVGHASWNPLNSQGAQHAIGSAYAWATGHANDGSFNEYGASTKGRGATATTVDHNGRTVTSKYDDMSYDQSEWGTKKYAKANQAWVDNNMSRLQAVGNLITDPQLKAQYQWDMQNAQYQNVYMQLQQMFAQFADTAAGQAAMHAINNNNASPDKDGTWTPKQWMAYERQQQQAAAGTSPTDMAAKLYDPSTAVQAWQAGDLGSADVLPYLKQNVDAAKAKFLQTHDPQDYQDYIQKLGQFNQAMGDVANAALQVAQSVNNGSPQQAAATLGAAVQSMRSAQNGQQALQGWNAVVQAFQQQGQANAANAQTPDQVVAAQTGSVTMDPATRQKIADAYFNGDTSKVPGTFTGYLSPQQKYSIYQQGTQASQALAATQSKFGANDPAQQAAAAVAAANQNLANLKKAGDNYQPDIDKANADLAQANQQAKDAAAQQSESSSDMYAQMFSNAPLQAAQYARQKLQTALGDAHSQAEYNQIQGQLYQLNNQIAQDTIANADAIAGIAQATALAQGNPILAAQKKYQQDLADIATRQQADSAAGITDLRKDTTLQNMIGQATNDQTAILTTQFSYLQQYTQNELYLGTATATQVITQLEQGLKAAQGNAQLVQQYQVAIRQIQNSAGANLNFDIPQNLLINPTLYQAARVNQMGSAGYNGNVVNVTVNVNNPSNTPGAVNTLLSAIGANRSGAVGSVVSTPLAPSGA